MGYQGVPTGPLSSDVRDAIVGSNVRRMNRAQGTDGGETYNYGTALMRAGWNRGNPRLVQLGAALIGQDQAFSRAAADDRRAESHFDRAQSLRELVADRESQQFDATQRFREQAHGDRQQFDYDQLAAQQNMARQRLMASLFGEQQDRALRGQIAEQATADRERDYGLRERQLAVNQLFRAAQLKQAARKMDFDQALGLDRLKADEKRMQQQLLLGAFQHDPVAKMRLKLLDPAVPRSQDELNAIEQDFEERMAQILGLGK